MGNTRGSGRNLGVHALNVSVRSRVEDRSPVLLEDGPIENLGEQVGRVQVGGQPLDGDHACAAQLAHEI